MMKHYLKIMGIMMWRDLYVLNESLKDLVINACLWTLFMLVTNAYVMPQLGIPADYGLFMLAGSIVGQCIIQAMNFAAIMVADLSMNKETTQYLVTPLPTWLVFIRFGLTCALRTMLIGLLMLPLGKLLLWQQFNLMVVFSLKFILMFIATNLFFGMGSIWIAARTPTLLAFENTWMRLIVPLWFGSTNFSWHTLYKAMPVVAYIDLFNPILYTTEGLHAAMLNPADFINFWICLSVTLACTVLLGWRGIVMMKQRLDFV